MQVKKQQLELDKEQQTGSKLEMVYVKSLYSHAAYLMSMQNTSCDMWNARLDESEAGIKTTGRNINNFIYADDTTLIAESKEKLNNLLMSVKQEGE